MKNDERNKEKKYALINITHMNYINYIMILARARSIMIIYYTNINLMM